MISTSTMAGTFVSVEVPGASKAAAINFNTEFLAPRTDTLPCSRCPPVRLKMP